MRIIKYNAMSGFLKAVSVHEDYLQPQDSITMFGKVFRVAVLLLSMKNNCKDENCFAVQQGVNSNAFLPVARLWVETF